MGSAVDIRKKVKSLPLASGVYLMKNKAGTVVYVGKAVCLRKRVQSYFSGHGRGDSKVRSLVAEVVDIECMITASEAGALILEASLIKRFKPKYNIDLRDDKTYPFIEITKEKFPIVSIVRPRTRKSSEKKPSRRTGVVSFGPYVNAQLVREALKIIRKIFPFRTCRPLRKKACLDHHIGLCPGPCIDAMGARTYTKNIKNIRLILEGKKNTLCRNLRNEMQSLAKAKKFEAAAQVRDQLRAIGALYSGTPDINYYTEAEQLQRALNLAKRPDHIEAFDISNIMGTEAVGAMVSFANGKPDKKNYRRFRIRDVHGIDDCKMIAEVVYRRYRRLKAEGLLFPDLIIIDGGKGQLSSAHAVLKALQADIPVISIAKRLEEIFLPHRRHAVRLAADSLGLQLLQRIRNEAHRFAISYHRKLRSKKVFDEKTRTH